MLPTVALCSSLPACRVPSALTSPKEFDPLRGKAGEEQDCFGLGVDCAYVVGATQLGRDEAYSTTDALLGQDYRWLGQRAGRALDGFIPFPGKATGRARDLPLLFCCCCCWWWRLLRF